MIGRKVAGAGLLTIRDPRKGSAAGPAWAVINPEAQIEGSTSEGGFATGHRQDRILTLGHHCRGQELICQIPANSRKRK